jgi:hypothetical protein
VRGDFGNLPVADIEDSEAAAARHEGVTDVPVRLVADERGWVGCLPVLEHPQKSVGQHAAVLLGAPKLARLPSAAEHEKGELARLARLSKQTLTTMARALERETVVAALVPLVRRAAISPGAS